MGIDLEKALALPLHTLVTFGFLITLGLYALFSFILYYHWKEYASDSKVKRITLVAYFGSTLPLITLLGLVTLII